jgi:hypothetical protein
MSPCLDSMFASVNLWLCVCANKEVTIRIVTFSLSIKMDDGVDVFKKKILCVSVFLCAFNSVFNWLFQSLFQRVFKWVFKCFHNLIFTAKSVFVCWVLVSVCFRGVLCVSVFRTLEYSRMFSINRDLHNCRSRSF